MENLFSALKHFSQLQQLYLNDSELELQRLPPLENEYHILAPFQILVLDMHRFV